MSDDFARLVADLRRFFLGEGTGRSSNNYTLTQMRLFRAVTDTEFEWSTGRMDFFVTLTMSERIMKVEIKGQHKLVPMYQETFYCHRDTDSSYADNSTVGVLRKGKKLFYFSPTN